MMTLLSSCQEARSDRKHDERERVSHLVCSLGSSWSISLPGSAQWWNFRQDRRRTVNTSSETHLAGEQEGQTRTRRYSACQWRMWLCHTLTLHLFFFSCHKKRAVLQKQLFSVLFSNTDSTLIIHFKQWVNDLYIDISIFLHPYIYTYIYFYIYIYIKRGLFLPGGHILQLPELLSPDTIVCEYTHTVRKTVDSDLMAVKFELRVNVSGKTEVVGNWPSAVQITSRSDIRSQNTSPVSSY